jgi:hypothetical protein
VNPSPDKNGHWSANQVMFLLEQRSREQDNRLADFKELVKEQFKAAENAVRLALDSAKEAVATAAKEQDKRNAAYNELRGVVDKTLDTKLGISDWGLAKEALEARIVAIDRATSARLQALESGGTGRREGQQNVWGYVVGGLGLLFGLYQVAIHFGKP